MKRNLLPVCAIIVCYASPAYAEVSVEHVWVRMPPPVAAVAAAYMTLHNDSGRNVVITAVHSSVSRSAGIHSMRVKGGMMQMQRLENLTLPAHGSVRLTPGGMHIMLNDLKQALKPNQAVHISLQFADGSSVDADAPVRDMRPEPAQPLYEKAMSLARKKNMTDAASLLHQAGEKGNRRAQYQLGLLYARGDGVKKDFIKAREWLHKAAMQGHPKAQFYLGQMYAFGDGGEKDNAEAVTWFWLATTMGDRFARDSLRVVTGKVSPRELTKARKRAKALWQEMPHDMKIEHKMTMH